MGGIKENPIVLNGGWDKREPNSTKRGIKENTNLTLTNWQLKGHLMLKDDLINKSLINYN